VDSEPAPAVFLVIGIPGSGKSTVSATVARRFGLRTPTLWRSPRLRLAPASFSAGWPTGHPHDEFLESGGGTSGEHYLPWTVIRVDELDQGVPPSEADALEEVAEPQRTGRVSGQPGGDCVRRALSRRKPGRARHPQGLPTCPMRHSAVAHGVDVMVGTRAQGMINKDAPMAVDSEPGLGGEGRNNETGGPHGEPDADHATPINSSILGLRRHSVRVVAGLLTGRDLVQPHPLHELGPGVDQRHVGVPELTGNPVGRGESPLRWRQPFEQQQKRQRDRLTLLSAIQRPERGVRRQHRLGQPRAAIILAARAASNALNPSGATVTDRAYAAYSGVLTRPIKCPSGSWNKPISISSMTVSGPIIRVPPRLSAWAIAASTSGTPT
jgi:hypothetical protein